MLALANEAGVNIGMGIWGALYYAATGIITVYNGLKPTSQRFAGKSTHFCQFQKYNLEL
jgi:hypothetical protein